MSSGCGRGETAAAGAGPTASAPTQTSVSAISPGLNPE